METKADLLAVFSFVPSNWAQDYTGLWLNLNSLLITVVRARNQSDATWRRSDVAVGAMNVTVLPSGGLKSFDGTSSPSNSSKVRSCCTLVCNCCHSIVQSGCSRSIQ